MNYEQAMMAVAAGKRVRRKAWRATEQVALQTSYAVIFTEGLNFRRERFLCHPGVTGRFDTPFAVTDADIAGEDWESVT